MSIAQPSPQGLAALSMGNPAPLQKRVAASPKDPQTGLPQDLAAALALSIDLTTQNAAQRQEAMSQLQQAAGPTGQMPTVVQSLQDAARQKLNAQAQPNPQAQTEPPQEAPQQSAGLAQAPVEFGMAGGGLVSFANEGATLNEVTREVLKELGVTAKDYISNPETAKTVNDLAKERSAGLPAAQPATAAAAPATSAAPTGRSYGAGRVAGKVLSRTAPLAAAGEVISHLGDYKLASPDNVDTSAAGTWNELKQGNLGRTGTSLGRGLAEAGMDLGSAAANIADLVVPGKAPVSSAYDAMLRRNFDLQKNKDEKALTPQQIERAAAQQTSLPPTGAGAGRGNVNPPMANAAPAPAAPSPIDDLEKAVTQRARPAAAAGAAPAAGLPGAIPTDPRLEKMMNLDPAAREKDVMERMQAMAPNTAGYDRMVAELEKRKQQLEGPKAGFEGFMEYLERVALEGPQRTVGEAGTKGAAGLKALQKERAQQQFDLTKEQIGLEDKKNEAVRAFKMDVFKTGQTAYDNAYKQAFDALKEKGQNDRQASANATQIATNAATVAEQARGHTLQAQAEIARLKTAERRADKEEAALSLKALSEAAKELGALLKDPAYATTNEAASTRTQLNQITAEIAKRGGVKDMGFSAAPAAPVAGKLK
jgi:hypothetical protein